MPWKVSSIMSERWEFVQRPEAGMVSMAELCRRFGNIFRPGFDHLLHLAFLEKDRRATFREECADCVMRNICAGGCAPANLTHTGSLYHPAGTACTAARIAHRHAMLLHDELYAEGNELLMKKFYSKAEAR